jgi:peptide/nickel transport system ATP-binding protein
MRQRVMIAMALSCEPELLIADEPTTALDVTIQAQILDLLRRLQARAGHGRAAHHPRPGCRGRVRRDVVVMYAGRVVETAGVRQIFADPLHPYTQGLLASVPPMDSSRVDGKPRRLTTIDGVVPDLAHLPAGCRFADRCALFASGRDGVERCTRQEPELRQLADGRAVRCHFAGGEN